MELEKSKQFVLEHLRKALNTAVTSAQCDGLTPSVQIDILGALTEEIGDLLIVKERETLLCLSASDFLDCQDLAKKLDEREGFNHWTRELLKKVNTIRAEMQYNLDFSEGFDPFADQDTSTPWTCPCNVCQPVPCDECKTD